MLRIRMDYSNSSLAPVANTLALERRRGLRFDVTRKFIAVDIGEDNGGLLLNLSENGAAVQVVSRLPRGASTKFSFASVQQNSRVIEGRAVVAWAANAGRVAGLRFERLFPGSEAELKLWLRRCNGPEVKGRAFATTAPARVPAVSQEQPVRTLRASTGLTAQTPGSLADLVHHARLLTAADGASLALKNPEGQFVCVCSEGMAPAIGIVIKTDRGLCAECIVTSSVVICEDATRDRRINPAARGELGSAVIVPVSANSGKTALGVLAVFSRRMNVFSAPHSGNLQTLAKAIALAAISR